MIRRFSARTTVGLATILGIGGCTLLLAQEPAVGRAGANATRPTPAVLIMKAEFKPAVAGKTEQLPFVQANVVDPNLELKQYGAGKDVLTNAGNPAQFIPFSAWTGMTGGPFALTFRDKANLLDLSGGAKIRWATKTSGFHGVRPVIKLADGSMFVGDVTSENVAMMAVSEFPVATVRWVKLDRRIATLNCTSVDARFKAGNASFAAGPSCPSSWTSASPHIRLGVFDELIGELLDIPTQSVAQTVAEP